MTVEALQILSIAAIVLSLIALAVAFVAMRNSRKAGAADHGRLSNEINAMRTELEGIRDRHRMIEERFERYDRTQTELREGYDRTREDLEARFARNNSQESGQKALQEQIYEIRKEHQVLMERGDRHDRRVAELHDQITAMQADLTRTRTDGVKSRV